MSVVFNSTDPALMKKLVSAAEDAFSVRSDDTQIPASQESRAKFFALDAHCLAVDLDESNNPRGYVLLIPTQKDLADRFLKGEITERRMFDLTERSDAYDALYLCAALTMPEHRRKGVATKLLLETVEKFTSKYPIKIVFAWPYSEEGAALGRALEAKIGRQIVFKA